MTPAYVIIWLHSFNCIILHLFDPISEAQLTGNALVRPPVRPPGQPAALQQTDREGTASEW